MSSSAFDAFAYILKKDGGVPSFFIFAAVFNRDIYRDEKNFSKGKGRERVPLPPIRGGRVTDYSVSEVTWTSRLSGSFFFAGYAILA